MEHTVTAKAPQDFAEPDIHDFLAMVRSGGEVGEAALENNIRNAKCLAVARQGSCLVGVAALKNPLATYRSRIQTKTGVAVDKQDFPFELGYIFVVPSARRQGIGDELCRAALDAADGWNSGDTLPISVLN